VHIARLPLRWWRRRSGPAYLGPFLVTPATLVPPLLRFADAHDGSLVVDLGCGDGRFLVEAAAMGCRARGVESDPQLVARSRTSVASAGVEDLVEVVHGDATTADLSDADIVVMFLPVTTLRDLLPGVISRLRPGARLIVHEQERLDPSLKPHRSVPIASPDGVTVAHRWDG
jgi:23S rRNA G2445 N2-methylase RlmL